MRTIIVVAKPEEWPQPSSPAVELISGKSYLTDPRHAESRESTRVVNLANSYEYQGVGYYVSLLASARGHKVIPSVMALQALRNNATVRLVGDELEASFSRALKDVVADKRIVRCLFSTTDDALMARFAPRLFGLFQVPLLKLTVRRREGKWYLQHASPMGAKELSEEERGRVLGLAEGYLQKGAPKRRLKSYRYDVALLRDPEERDAPSNAQALARIEHAGEQLGLRVEQILKDDYGSLSEYDALFIRATTQVDHYTYRFSQRAAAEGLVVIDDPVSILKCTNKVFLAELLSKHKIPHPATRVIARDSLLELKDVLPYPCILKKPDGCFSQGTVRADDPASFLAEARKFLNDSELVLAQEFVPTAYDWRIGVFDGKPLYACRYFMAKGHWQVIRRDGAGNHQFGDFETLPIEQVPPAVVETAVRATKLIGLGLYGVDLKEVGGRPVIMEVNDNPNIDAGVEDKVLGNELYRVLMSVFLDRIEKKKRGG